MRHHTLRFFSTSHSEEPQAPEAIPSTASVRSRGGRIKGREAGAEPGRTR